MNKYYFILNGKEDAIIVAESEQLAWDVAAQFFTGKQYLPLMQKAPRSFKTQVSFLITQSIR